MAEFAEQLTVSVARLGYGTNRSAPQVESSVGLTIEINNNDRITATIMASDLNEAVDAIAMVTIELDRALPAGLAADEVQLVLVNTGDRAADVERIIVTNIATDLGRYGYHRDDTLCDGRYDSGGYRGGYIDCWRSAID